LIASTRRSVLAAPPQDPRDVIVFKSPVKVDDFALKFQKPN